MSVVFPDARQALGTGIGDLRPMERTISIIDDDESVREAIRSLLVSTGHHVQVFASAEDFLSTPSHERTRCLIADVNMPGMTGLALHRHLTELGRRIPTILITAFPDDHGRELARKTGVVGYLVKPFHETDLLELISLALGKN